MGLNLSGRTALITGASSGIGAATATALTQAGCLVRLVGRDEARLATVAASTGGHALPADLGTAAGLDTVASATEDVDILVNNAGLGWAGQLDEMAAEDIPRLVDANLTAPLRLTRAAWPGMTQRQRGSVVFLSSIAVVGVRDEAVYAATKAGLRAFADSIRYAAKRDHIGVTTVLPAGVRTPFFERRGRAYERTFPKEVTAQRVAQALVRAIENGTPEVFVPRWLGSAVRLHGLLPGGFHRLADRFS